MHAEDLPLELRAVVEALDRLPEDLRSRLEIRQLASDAGLMVICVGHSNSERLTLTALARRLADALPALEVLLAGADRDPIQII